MSHVQLLSLIFCYGPLIIILPITICGRLSVCLSLCTYRIYHLLFNNADHRLNQTSHTLLMPSNKIMPNYFACCTRKSKQINENKKHIQFAEFTFTFENFRRCAQHAADYQFHGTNKYMHGRWNQLSATKMQTKCKTWWSLITTLVPWTWTLANAQNLMPHCWQWSGTPKYLYFKHVFKHKKPFPMGKYGHYEFYNKFIGLNFIWRMDNMAQIVGILCSGIISKSTLL